MQKARGHYGKNLQFKTIDIQHLVLAFYPLGQIYDGMNGSHIQIFYMRACEGTMKVLRRLVQAEQRQRPCYPAVRSSKQLRDVSTNKILWGGGSWNKRKVRGRSSRWGVHGDFQEHQRPNSDCGEHQNIDVKFEGKFDTPSPRPRHIPPRTSLHLHKFGIGATRDLNIGMAAPARPVTQQDVSTSKVSSIKGGKVTLMVSSRLQALFKVSKETSALIPRHKVVGKTIKPSVRMANF